jgi:hypothetical protein
MCSSAESILKFRPILDKIAQNKPLTDSEIQFCQLMDYPISKLKPILHRSVPLS